MASLHAGHRVSDDQRSSRSRTSALYAVPRALHICGAEAGPLPSLHGLHLPRWPAALCLQGRWLIGWSSAKMPRAPRLWYLIIQYFLFFRLGPCKDSQCYKTHNPSVWGGVWASAGTAAASTRGHRFQPRRHLLGRCVGAVFPHVYATGHTGG